MAKFAEDDIAQFIAEQQRLERLDARLNKANSSNFGYQNGRINVGGSSMQDQGIKSVGGRLGYTQPIDDTSRLDMGVTGHTAKGDGWKNAGLDQADFTYAKRLANNSELRAKLRKNIGDSKGAEYIGAEYEIPFKKGGKVKAKPKVSKASSRGDGCAQRGKTRGKLK